MSYLVLYVGYVDFLSEVAENGWRPIDHDEHFNALSCLLEHLGNDESHIGS
jgi:hypothetical protein